MRWFRMRERATKATDASPSSGKEGQRTKSKTDGRRFAVQENKDERGDLGYEASWSGVIHNQELEP